jgi:hypothetical protein
MSDSNHRSRKSVPRTATGSCPAGFHPRRSYRVSRTGTRVAAACVRATTRSGPRKRMTMRLRGVTSCPSGQIVRDAYVRGRRQFVPAACIKNVGNPGKGIPSGAPGTSRSARGFIPPSSVGRVGIGPLRKGDLSRFGYDDVTSMSEGRRHLALAAAVRSYGSLTVWRKLNAVFVYTKNTSPASSRVFKADRDWVKEHFGIAAF